MTKILIIGAGRSATSLIEYLLDNAKNHDWKITVSDVDLKLAQTKTANNPLATAISFDIRNEEQRKKLLENMTLSYPCYPLLCMGMWRVIAWSLENTWLRPAT